jgi:hypothetical protein
MAALKTKACTHALEALHDPDYDLVAKEAIDLYRTLRHELKNPNGRKTLRNCEAAIEKAKPVLKAHRGILAVPQALLDILNVLLNLITFKFAWSDNWRFFEIRTESIERTDEVGDCIKQHLGVAT